MSETDEKITELCETIKALPDAKLATFWWRADDDDIAESELSTTKLKALADRYKQKQTMLAAAHEFLFQEFAIGKFDGKWFQLAATGQKLNSTEFDSALEAFAAITEDKNERNDK